VHRLVILNENKTIRKADLPDSMKSRTTSEYNVKKSLTEVEVDHILKVLEYCGNNKTKAAEILQIDRKTLNNKLNRIEE